MEHEGAVQGGDLPHAFPAAPHRSAASTLASRDARTSELVALTASAALPEADLFA